MANIVKIMTKKIKKIEFEELPTELQKVIRQILADRKQIRRFLKFYTGAAASSAVISTSLIGIINEKQILEKTIQSMSAIALTFGGVGIKEIKSIQDRYTKMEMRLYSAIKRNHTIDSKLGELIKKYPFVAVNWKGELIGKKHAPKIWFLPIGRRAISTTKPPLKEIKKKKKIWNLRK